jgi:hypothetical protein
MKKLLLVCLLTIAQSSYSADLTEVKIFGEEIKDCNLSKDSVTAALVGTMRYNRINVTENRGGIVLYHQVTALNINGGCAVSAKLEFKVYEYVFIKSLNKNVMSSVVICDRGTILTGPTHNMQTRVNSSLRDIAQECVVEISKQ